jgi:hypothetical protein
MASKEVSLNALRKIPRAPQRRKQVIVNSLLCVNG